MTKYQCKICFKVVPSIDLHEHLRIHKKYELIPFVAWNLMT